MEELVKPATISIVGGTGKLGTLFREAFKKEGIEVLVSGRKTELSNIDITKRGDIVIVTVPIRDTARVIEEIGEYVREGACITDFTSVKMNPVKAMLDSCANGCEVFGGHPLFGPTAGFENQNYILCKERAGKYYVWYKNFLEGLGLKIIEMSADEHDKNMAVIQCLTHLSNLSLGNALASLNCDLKAIENISTPVYLMRIFNVGRILAQDEELYNDIQMENPYSKEVSAAYLKSVQDLDEVVQRGDRKGFTNMFLKCRSYFESLIEKSMSVTDKMIRVMKNE